MPTRRLSASAAMGIQMKLRATKIESVLKWRMCEELLDRHLVGFRPCLNLIHDLLSVAWRSLDPQSAVESRPSSRRHPFFLGHCPRCLQGKLTSWPCAPQTHWTSVHKAQLKALEANSSRPAQSPVTPGCFSCPLGYNELWFLSVKWVALPYVSPISAQKRAVFELQLPCMADQRE